MNNILAIYKSLTNEIKIVYLINKNLDIISINNYKNLKFLNINLVNTKSHAC